MPAPCYRPPLAGGRFCETPAQGAIWLGSLAELHGTTRTTRTTLRKLNPTYADYREWPGDAPLPLGEVLNLFAIRPSSSLPAGETLVVPLYRPSTSLPTGSWLFLPRRRAAASAAPLPDF